MRNYYFTFGTDERFPFKNNEYIRVTAPNIVEAKEIFRQVHPNREGSELLNYAFDYTEEEFDRIRDKHYEKTGLREMLCYTNDKKKIEITSINYETTYSTIKVHCQELEEIEETEEELEDVTL